MKAFLRSFALMAILVAGTASAADKDPGFPIDRVLGKLDAPVTFYEYASTTCGHCATFHKTVLPELKKTWIDTGKAKLVFRDFPTGPAQLSVGASMIAHCAGPERYFGVLGLIMDAQDKWMRAKDPLEELKKLVRLAGMTAADVDTCLGKQDLADQVMARADDANKRLGIDSTPTVVIGKEKLVGVRDIADYDKALKAAQ